jgi:predicted sugar kinase
MNNILSLIEKRQAQLNANLSRAMLMDLLNDVIGDLKTFESIEQIQDAIKFLENTKLQLQHKPRKS